MLIDNFILDVNITKMSASPVYLLV